MERELRALNGAPAILIGSAGEVNAGEFDPIEPLADLAERYGAGCTWTARSGCSPPCRSGPRHLVAGVERADSVIADGHKWLNVPYDCGFAFVRDRSLMTAPFALSAAYLARDDEDRAGLRLPGGRELAAGPLRGRLGDARAPTAATATGRWSSATSSWRSASPARVDEEPDLERLADVPLNVVCFRYRPAGVADERAGRAQPPNRRSRPRGTAPSTSAPRSTAARSPSAR